MLSYRLLLFERDADGEFKPPDGVSARRRWSRRARTTCRRSPDAGKGTTSTCARALGLVADESRRGSTQERARDRAHAAAGARARRGCCRRRGTVRDVADRHAGARARDAAFLARTPVALIVVVQLEDVLLGPRAGERAGHRRRSIRTGAASCRSRSSDVEREPFASLARRLSQARRAALDAAHALRRATRHRAPSAMRSARGRDPARDLPPAAAQRLHASRDATALVPYLAALGVSHVYCSPYLRARPGSRTATTSSTTRRSTPRSARARISTLRRGARSSTAWARCCDMVPNHMGVMGERQRVVAGRARERAGLALRRFFDIDWRPPDRDLAGKVLLPVLGDHYGVVLERGELELGFEREPGAFAVRYSRASVPDRPARVSARSSQLAAARRRGAAAARARGASARASSTRFAHAAAARADARRSARRAHARQGARTSAELARLARAHRRSRDAIDALVQRVQRHAGRRRRFDALHALLEAQAYRLAYWRVAADEINYRRFFDINDLAALRMEDEPVFDATHRFVLELAAEGKIDGAAHRPSRRPLRSGARTSRACRRAIASCAAQRPAAKRATRPHLRRDREDPPPHEELPDDWAVHGDTGYRFANVVMRVLVDPTARRRVDASSASSSATRRATSSGGVRRQARHHARPLAAGLNVLASRRAADRARRPPHARLHVQHAARGARRDGRVLPGLPHLHRRHAALRRRTAATSTGRSRARGARRRFADPTIFDFMRALLLAAPPDDAPRSTAARAISSSRCASSSSPRR